MIDSVPLDLLVLLVASFVGAVVAGVAGFAFGLIASAIWLRAIAPTQSAALIAAFAIVIQGSTLWKLRHAVRARRLLPFLIGGALGTPLGAEVLRWATPAQMRAIVGLTLVLFSVYSLARPKLPIVSGGGVLDGAVGEPPLVCRRLQLLRDWSHDESKDIREVFRRGA